MLWRLSRLGKRVLCVDYVDNGKRGDAKNNARIADFLAKCGRFRFEPYVANADRELDSINRIPGLQPAE